MIVLVVENERFESSEGSSDSFFPTPAAIALYTRKRKKCIIIMN